ncbi:hypothetical protein H8R17_44470 [Streptomyces sp. TRM68367]|nr:hypothetical protein [Streptomyces sp. TRM68367]
MLVPRMRVVAAHAHARPPVEAVLGLDGADAAQARRQFGLGQGAEAQAAP